MVEILPDGRLVVPVRADSGDGTIIGDGVMTIDQSHPDFQKWMAWIERTKVQPEEQDLEESDEPDESDSDEEVDE